MSMPGTGKSESARATARRASPSGPFRASPVRFAANQDLVADGPMLAAPIPPRAHEQDPRFQGGAGPVGRALGRLREPPMLRGRPQFPAARVHDAPPRANRRRAVGFVRGSLGPTLCERTTTARSGGLGLRRDPTLRAGAELVRFPALPEMSVMYRIPLGTLRKPPRTLNRVA